MSSILESIKSVKNPFTDEPEEVEDDDGTGGMFREVGELVSQARWVVVWLSSSPDTANRDFRRGCAFIRRYCISSKAGGQ
jgi:hypothetical protein